MTERIVNLTGHDGEDELNYGAVIFDGDSITQVIGPDGTDEMLQRIVDAPVIIEINDDLESVLASEEPETWFNGLPLTYKSHALMASIPRDLTDDDLEGYEVKEDETEE